MKKYNCYGLSTVIGVFLNINLLYASEPLIYPHDNDSYAHIHIISASCGSKKGNATNYIKKICENKEYCYFNLKSFCKKNLQVSWTCGKDSYVHKNPIKDAKIADKYLITCGIN